jgi:hypothetical protein
LPFAQPAASESEAYFPVGSSHLNGGFLGFVAWLPKAAGDSAITIADGQPSGGTLTGGDGIRPLAQSPPLPVVEHGHLARAPFVPGV